MGICDTNLMRSCIGPAKDYAPLLVDPDTVITFQISAQGFQPISRWSFQVISPSCVMEHIKFSPSYSANAGPSNPLSQLSGKKELFSVSIRERLESHGYSEFTLQRYTESRYSKYTNQRFLAGVYQYMPSNFRFYSTRPVVCGLRKGHLC
jgi:hypothetical protein